WRIENPGIDGPLCESWSWPPLLYACGRYGFANRGALATVGAAAATAGDAAPALTGLAGACLPADAGVVGFGSAVAPSLSSLLTWPDVTDWALGTGYVCASFFRRP